MTKRYDHQILVRIPKQWYIALKDRDDTLPALLPVTGNTSTITEITRQALREYAEKHDIELERVHV